MAARSVSTIVAFAIIFIGLTILILYPWKSSPPTGDGGLFGAIQLLCANAYLNLGATIIMLVTVFVAGLTYRLLNKSIHKIASSSKDFKQ